MNRDRLVRHDSDVLARWLALRRVQEECGTQATSHASTSLLIDKRHSHIRPLLRLLLLRRLGRRVLLGEQPEAARALDELVAD